MSLSRSDRPGADDLFLALENLNSLVVSSEAEFLRLGARLQSFHDQAVNICRIGNLMAETMSSPEAEQSLRSLEEHASEVKTCISASSGELEKDLALMRSVHELIRSAAAPLEDFRRIVSRLRTLGISARIESARLEKNGQSFLFLADEVIRQSLVIGANVNDVIARLNSLGLQIRQAMDRQVSLGTRQADQGREIMDEVQLCLDNFKDKRRTAARAADNMLMNSRDISRAIGEVVSSMQFHDITRQQIEHVNAAIDMALEGSETAVFSDVCRLQAVHLRHAEAELLAAGEGIIRNLGGVSRDIKEILAAAVKLTGAAGKEGDSSLLDVEGTIMAVISALEAFGLMDGELFKVKATMTETLEVMASFLKDIEQIGESIRFIAMNAAIKAAQLDMDGLALNALARSIRQLSVEARERTGQVEEILKAIVPLTGKLRKSDGSSAAGVPGTIGLVTDDLEQLMSITRELGRRAKALLRNVDRDSRNLAREIDECLKNITVHLAMSEVLRRAMAELDKIASDRRSDRPVDSGARRMEVLNDLAGRYTMQSERIIHQAAAAGGHVLPPEGACAAGGENEKLGDNIELF